MLRGSEAISPTAHFTGYVWYRNGLSHDAFATTRGRLMYDGLRPLTTATSLLGGPNLEQYLLARHRTLDDLLTGVIEEDGVTQVVEVAAGLSPRGWRFADRYGDRITYLETDLPDMAAVKRRALESIGSLTDTHRVEELDALTDDGPRSLRALAAKLDPGRPVALITEGLLAYLQREQVLGMWRRFAATLGTFPDGHYLSDLHLGEDAGGPVVNGFLAALSLFVGGRVSLDFRSSDEAGDALCDAGFDTVGLHRPDEHVRILHATVLSAREGG